MTKLVSISLLATADDIPALSATYLLLIVDASVPFATAGTSSLPLVHSIMFNCHVNNVSAELMVSMLLQCCKPAFYAAAE